MQARLIVYQRCVYYKKSLLESGTLGTKGNVQVIVPGLTESYGSSHDPPEKHIPMSTLKNFPYRIEHTLQWARDYFEGLFKTNAEEANSLLKNKQDHLGELRRQGPGTMLSTLEGVHSSLISERPQSVSDCIQWARRLFEKLFLADIRQLLHSFPKEALTRTAFRSGQGPRERPLQLNTM